MSQAPKWIVKYKEKRAPFAVEKWYPILQDHTFHTEVVALTPEHALAIVAYHRQRFLGHDMLKATDCKVLYGLRDDIHNCIESSRGFKDNGVFVRLSNRSPKDGIPLTTRLKQAYLKELDKLCDEGKEVWKREDPNTIAVAAFTAKAKMLRARTADAAMNLLLTSSRVYTDLLVALESHGIPTRTQFEASNPNGKELDVSEKKSEMKTDWSTNVLIREWNPLVKASHEFRTFVCNKRMTAITQYDHYCYHPSLPSLRDVIQLAIKKKWDEVQPLLTAEGYEDYVIDFALYSEDRCEGKAWNCFVIELNPFSTTTGSALFSWGKDSDILHGKGLLEGGPIPLRIHEKPIARIANIVERRLMPTIMGDDDKGNAKSSVDNEEPYYKLLRNVLTASSSSGLCWESDPSACILV